MQNRIQELRKAKKVTQLELANALNVTRQTIISLENGKYNASLTLAHKAAQFFGITIEELFIFEGDENLGGEVSWKDSEKRLKNVCKSIRCSALQALNIHIKLDSLVDIFPT